LDAPLVTAPKFNLSYRSYCKISAIPIARDIAAGDNSPNGRARRTSPGGCLNISIAGLVHDERKKTARNENFGTATPSYRANMGRIGTRQDTRFVAGFVAAIAAEVAAQSHDTPRQRASVPKYRQPARPPVLRQDYGRRPHRCLQSGSITSRRP
jgi:hypothetical protein